MSFLTRTSTTTLRTLRFAPRASFSTSSRSQKSATEAAKDAVKTVDRTMSNAAVKGIEKGRKSRFHLYLCLIVLHEYRSRIDPAQLWRSYGLLLNDFSPWKGPMFRSLSICFRLLLTADDTLEEAAAATREAIGINASKAEGTAHETAGSAQGTASELAGEAKGKASELAGKTKGNVAEAKGAAKAKAKEVASEI
jgi:uncharacterized protein YjbJ (UPF0337 family)